ncbi:MAG: DUF433 domain-containing protein [Acidobacteria bacterium]|nr:DUF433 domain-containing protein [Acidobacteriota bacterium]
MDFERITVNPTQMGGVPCIRGLRIPVATVVDMVANGMTPAEILGAYPDLDEADVREALRFAAEAVRERELPLLPAR